MIKKSLYESQNLTCTGKNYVLSFSHLNEEARNIAI